MMCPTELCRGDINDKTPGIPRVFPMAPTGVDSMQCVEKTDGLRRDLFTELRIVYIAVRCAQWHRPRHLLPAHPLEREISVRLIAFFAPHFLLSRRSSHDSRINFDWNSPKPLFTYRQQRRWLLSTAPVSSSVRFLLALRVHFVRDSQVNLHEIDSLL